MHRTSDFGTRQKRIHSARYVRFAHGMPLHLAIILISISPADMESRENDFNQQKKRMSALIIISLIIVYRERAASKGQINISNVNKICKDDD